MATTQQIAQCDFTTNGQTFKKGAVVDVADTLRQLSHLSDATRARFIKPGGAAAVKKD
jgi:hypothetical protein